MGAQEPPQSTSVSLLFLTPSVQLGTAQVLVVVPVHTPLAQSPAAAQTFPLAHFAHFGPPQLRSVSIPFLTASSQAGAAHSPPLHTPLAQSPPLVHILPSAQVGQAPPPQFRSVSAPFRAVSVHVGTAQVLVGVPVHTPLAQSPATAQPLPSMHFAQSGPPQSRSVSMPSFTTSEQVGAAHTPP